MITKQYLEDKILDFKVGISMTKEEIISSAKKNSEYFLRGVVANFFPFEANHKKVDLDGKVKTEAIAFLDNSILNLSMYGFGFGKFFSEYYTFAAKHSLTEPFILIQGLAISTSLIYGYRRGKSNKKLNF